MQQLVLVADEVSQHGEGALYGLFECHQPPHQTVAAGGGGQPAGRRKRQPEERA